jgi:hypothetical protein
MRFVVTVLPLMRDAAPNVTEDTVTGSTLNVTDRDTPALAATICRVAADATGTEVYAKLAVFTPGGTTT